jgi:hemicentin
VLQSLACLLYFYLYFFSSQNLTSVHETTSFNCYGNNTVGFKEKLFHVIVQTAPTFEKPYAEQLNVSLYLGINLECKVSGTPEPSVTWRKDGMEIISNNKQLYSTSQDEQILRILNAKKSDAGTYECEAENVVGRAKKSFNLDVKGNFFKELQLSIYKPIFLNS